MSFDLDLDNGSGDFIPYIKYDGRSGIVTTKTDDGAEMEVNGLAAICDLENIKSGWLLFQEGAAPSWTPDVAPGTRAAKPNDKAKRGFKVNWFSPKQLGGVREMAGNSKVLSAGITDLYGKFKNAPERAQGLVPVVKLASTIAVKTTLPSGGTTTNRQPVFEIVKWVERPAELSGADDAVPPPAPAKPAAPAPAAADDTEF